LFGIVFLKMRKSVFSNHRQIFFWKRTILNTKLWFCQIINCVFKNYFPKLYILKLQTYTDLNDLANKTNILIRKGMNIFVCIYPLFVLNGLMKYLIFYVYLGLLKNWDLCWWLFNFGLSPYCTKRKNVKTGA
jgi:hypothetical protein